MARERWTIDGYEITNGTYMDVEIRDGLYGTGAPVGGNTTVAGRMGELWRPKALGPGGFVLNMWVGGNSRADLEARYDELVRLFMRAKTLRTVVRYMANGGVRTCQAEVVSSLTPQPSGSLVMRLAVEFRIPDGYWYGGTASISATAGASLPKTLTFTGVLAASTAPMERLAYTITGPITNPVISDPVTGEYLSYAATIANGQTVTFDSVTWGISQTGGHTINQGAVTFSGSKYLSVQPGAPGTPPSVVLSGTSGGAATNLSITGRDTYLA